MSSENKVDYFIDNPPDKSLKQIKLSNFEMHQLAWPKQKVFDKKNNFAGFIMPKIRLNEAFTIEKLFSYKNRQKYNISEDILWRITVCRNLADLFFELHKNKYLVVDTKPANILIYKDMPAVCIIDCDGFKIINQPFKAEYITPEYIAPETNKNNPSSISYEQDIFALSVIVFQILNNGVHPYSGIPKSNKELNLQELIDSSSYPYGKTDNRNLKPSPVSAHKLLPDELYTYFDDVFAKQKRPPTDKLRKILDKYRRKENLKSCSQAGHRGFKKGCLTCFQLNLSKKAFSKNTRNNYYNSSSSNSYFNNQSYKSPWQNINQQPQKKSNDKGVYFFWGAIIFAVIMIIIVGQ